MDGIIENLRIGIVENDPSFLDKIVHELKSEIHIKNIWTWESAEVFWRDKNSKDLDILLLDIMLPGMNGIELADKVSIQNPETKIIILSNMNSDKLIFKALQNGAIGYMLKSELRSMTEIIHTIWKGGAILTPTIAFRVLKSFQKSDHKVKAQLTEREKQILELMVSGKTIEKVAEIFSLSKNTVNHHAKNIYRKLNVHNRTELARKANEAGLV